MNAQKIRQDWSHTLDACNTIGEVLEVKIWMQALGIRMMQYLGLFDSVLARITELEELAGLLRKKDLISDEEWAGIRKALEYFQRAYDGVDVCIEVGG